MVRAMPLAAAEAYACSFDDPVREQLEQRFLARELDRLLTLSGGGAVLDLGCGDGLVARLAGSRAAAYTGVDLLPPATGPVGACFVEHDLRTGLGPLMGTSFDLCVATFGVASHLGPEQLRRLVSELVEAARPGAVIALETLGLYSLEWPQLWDTAPGGDRTIAYELAAEVRVHPWSPDELRLVYADAGLCWLGALDRSVQAGWKLGEHGYWPGVPALREGLNALLRGDRAGAASLRAPLPPLPAHPAARIHHALARQRRGALGCPAFDPVAAAERIWALEPRSGLGVGHAVLAIACVP
jgi:SAM-dependent methyltransferase